VSRQEVDEKRTAAEVGRPMAAASDGGSDSGERERRRSEVARRTTVAAQQANVQRLTALRSFSSSLPPSTVSSRPAR
jgi:hypothetical protein